MPESCYHRKPNNAVPWGVPLPTYDYLCAKCKTTYETREGFDAPTTQKCQECGKGTAKRVLTAPRIVFKGSGFYATDSKSKTSSIADSGENAAAAGQSDSSAKPETKGEPAAPSGDTKPAKSEAPAAKSEPKPAKSAPAAASSSSSSD